jgi:hypothetical protein
VSVGKKNAWYVKKKTSIDRPFARQKNQNLASYLRKPALVPFVLWTFPPYRTLILMSSSQQQVRFVCRASRPGPKNWRVTERRGSGAICMNPPIPPWPRGWPAFAWKLSDHPDRPYDEDHREWRLCRVVVVRGLPHGLLELRAVGFQSPDPAA